MFSNFKIHLKYPNIKNNLNVKNNQPNMSNTMIMIMKLIKMKQWMILVIF